MGGSPGRAVKVTGDIWFPPPVRVPTKRQSTGRTKFKGSIRRSKNHWKPCRRFASGCQRHVNHQWKPRYSFHDPIHARARCVAVRMNDYPRTQRRHGLEDRQAVTRHIHIPFAASKQVDPICQTHGPGFRAVSSRKATASSVRMPQTHHACTHCIQRCAGKMAQHRQEHASNVLPCQVSAHHFF